MRARIVVRVVHEWKVDLKVRVDGECKLGLRTTRRGYISTGWGDGPRNAGLQSRCRHARSHTMVHDTQRPLGAPLINSGTF